MGAHYEYFDDGVDRGYAVRECAKRIMELSTDREKLREARQESAKLRQRIVGKGGGTYGFNNNLNPINEDAFYNKESSKRDRNRYNDRSRSSSSEKEDRDRYRPYDKKEKGEISLAERLGMKNNGDNKEDAEHIKKRSKEDQKEVDEVKKILSMPGENMKNYMADFDVFADDTPISNNQAPPAQNKVKTDNVDLFDFTSGDMNTQNNKQDILGGGMNLNNPVGMNQNMQGGMNNNAQMGQLGQNNGQNISYNNPSGLDLDQNSQPKKNDPFSGLESLI